MASLEVAQLADIRPIKPLTTTGGSATPQYPKDINELTTWLTDATARVIVLDKTFDYTTSEGTVTGTACTYRFMIISGLCIDTNRCELGHWRRMSAHLAGFLRCWQGQRDCYLLQGRKEPYQGWFQQDHPRYRRKRYHQGQGSILCRQECHRPEHSGQRPKPQVRLGWRCPLFRRRGSDLD